MVPVRLALDRLVLCFEALLVRNDLVLGYFLAGLVVLLEGLIVLLCGSFAKKWQVWLLNSCCVGGQRLEDVLRAELNKILAVCCFPGERDPVQCAPKLGLLDLGYILAPPVQKIPIVVGPSAKGGYELEFLLIGHEPGF